MLGKPEMLYSDAEPGLTSNMTQKWLREQNIAHNVTLRHAPVAERMIGHIKNQIIKAIRGTNKMWWAVVDAVVKGLQREPRQPQHSDDAERSGEEIQQK